MKRPSADQSKAAVFRYPRCAVIHEVPSIRQERGPGVLNFLPGDIDLGHRRGGTAGFGDAQQACTRRAKKDHTLPVPRTLAKSSVVLAQGLRRTALGIDLFQPAWKTINAEREEPAVGRPDRTCNRAL